MRDRQRAREAMRQPCLLRHIRHHAEYWPSPGNSRFHWKDVGRDQDDRSFSIGKGSCSCRTALPRKAPSNVQIRHAQRIRLNKLAARFDDVAHQFHKNIVGLVNLFDFYLQ